MAECVLRRLLNEIGYLLTEVTHTDKVVTEKYFILGKLGYSERVLPRERPPRKSDCHEEKLLQGEG